MNKQRISSFNPWNMTKLCSWALASLMLWPATAFSHGTVSYGTPNVIHACRGSLTSVLRKLNSGNCLASEESLHWNIEGPTGPQGDIGPQGPAGAGLTSIEQIDGIGCLREGFEGTIKLVYNATGNVILNCEVNATPAALLADPASLLFDAPGSFRTVFISNTGQLPTGALTVFLSGPFAFEFTILADTCSGQSLAGGANPCSIELHSESNLSNVPRIAKLQITAESGATASVDLSILGNRE